MPDQSWRVPLIVQAEAAVYVVINIALVALFFPAAVAIPLVVIIAIGGLIQCGRRGEVRLDTGAGDVTISIFLLTFRIPLAQVRSVRVRRGGLAISVTGRRWDSVRLGQPGRLVRWLRRADGPDSAAAGRLAQAITDAAEAAPAGRPGESTERVWPQTLVLMLLGCTGLAAVAIAFLVRTSWPHPWLAALAVIYAVWLGGCGVIMAVFAAWKLAAGRTAPAA